MMEKFEDRRKRELEEVSDIQKRKQIIQKYLVKQEIILKDITPSEPAHIRDISQDGEMLIIKTQSELPFQKGDRILMYKVYSRYVQIIATIQDMREGNLYLLKIESLGIAKKNRDGERIKPPTGTIWITNIRTSKSTIQATTFNIPTLVKVNLSEFERKLKPNFDFVKIDVFASLDRKFSVPKKTGKIFYIENTQNPDSYHPLNEDFVNFEEDMDVEVSKAMQEYKMKKIVSEVVMPITYINSDETVINIGCIHILSNSKAVALDTIMELKSLCFEMVDRIRESNTMINTKRFPVLDISKGGFKVKIDDPDLIEQLPRHLGFTFDLFFKMQSPLTAFGEIKSVKKDIDQCIHLSIAMGGTSSRAGEKKRFLENFEILLGVNKSRLK